MKTDPFYKMDEEEAGRVAYLIAGYIRQTLTEAEHDELDEWITASDDNQRLFEELTDPDRIQEGLRMMENVNEEAALRRIKNKISFTDGPAKKAKKWIPYSIAASLIILAGLVIFFMMNKKSNADRGEYAKKTEIVPGGNFATLTISNGKMINLNEASNGLIDSSNGYEVLKSAEGQISYEGKADSKNEFHILSTPAGGQYKVILPDGTRVWLNSLSSLRYPVLFDAEERVVELTGEGYFEVAKEKPAPVTGIETGRKFIVKLKNNSRVEVLGTHFNISAYDDEKEIRTSLLEGIVSVRSNDAEKLLNPGYQSLIRDEGSMLTELIADASAVTAWKDGMFKFKDADIGTVMRQIARWYDVEIVYEGKVAYHFNATIKMSEPIDKLLHILEETNEVHFSVEGRRIVVRQ